MPELDLPGHSGRLIADAQDIFGLPGNGSTVNIASPKTLAALTVLMNEVMDVFQSTPYVHLGADEVGLGGLDQTAGIQGGPGEVRHQERPRPLLQIHRRSARRRRQARQEGHRLGGSLESRRRLSVAQGRDRHGHGPTAAIPPTSPRAAIRSSTPRGRPSTSCAATNGRWSSCSTGRSRCSASGHLGDDTFTTLTETDKILGAQLCSWENPENIEIQSMRDRLALVAEKAWNPAAGGTLAEFKARLAHTDPLLDKLVNPIIDPSRREPSPRTRTPSPIL